MAATGATFPGAGTAGATNMAGGEFELTGSPPREPAEPGVSDPAVTVSSPVATGTRLVGVSAGGAAICRFYNLKRPKVEWFEYIDWGKTAGKTYEDGKIHLVHPENWKNGRKYNSERQWINAVYHEMGHYIFWADAERKADTFAFRMARGVSNGSHHQNGRRARRG